MWDAIGMITLFLALPIALIGTIVSAIKRKPAWKKWLTGTGVALVLVMVSAVNASHSDRATSPSPTVQTAQVAPSKVQQATEPQVQPPAPSVQAQPQSSTQSEQKSQVSLITAKVTRVVDGDTIHVSIDGKDETVRLIGVDTPETHHPSQPVEPYGPEAESFTRSQLDGKTVYLEKDVQERDKYGRLLAYVWLEKPTEFNDQEVRAKMFNARLLLDGYAQLLTIPPNVKYVDYFRQYQTEAREGNKGLWALGPVPNAPPASSGQSVQASASITQLAPAGDQVQDKKEITVYVTRTGKKYHRDGCRYLAKSKIPMSLSDAKAAGYEPCSVCNPPR